MKFTISGKNIDITEGLKSAVRDKLGRRSEKMLSL